MKTPLRAITAWYALVVLAISLGSCIAAKGGSDFDAEKASSLSPGVTTIESAAADLGAQPYQIWRRSDGTIWGHWLYYDVSYDAGGTRVYNEELTLEFSEEGTLIRTVSSKGGAAMVAESGR